MANEIVVTENFQTDKMWSALPTAPGYICKIYSYNVDRAARKPLDAARSQPLRLTWPEHQVFRAEITLPAALPAEPGAWPVNSPAFHFHKSVSRVPGKILLEFEFDSLAEAVPVEAIPAYLGQLDQVSKLLGHSFFSY
jgi:hypothetical protein